VKLTPAVNYPFPTHIRVLRGVVIDTFGAPVADAEVSQGITEKTLSDEKGMYGLPLRWATNGVLIPIDATDHRTGRMGTIQITLPQALGSNQTIIVT
jgi:hypothetical protein